MQYCRQNVYNPALSSTEFPCTHDKHDKWLAECTLHCMATLVTLRSMKLFCFCNYQVPMARLSAVNSYSLRGSVEHTHARLCLHFLGTLFQPQKRTNDVDASPTTCVASNDQAHVNSLLSSANHPPNPDAPITRLPSSLAIVRLSLACIPSSLLHSTFSSFPIFLPHYRILNPSDTSSCPASPPNLPEECRTQILPQRAPSRALKM
jgi:hypothetical protein